MKTKLVVAASSGPVGIKSESRNASNKPSARSQFFSMLMSELAGDQGNEVSEAIVSKDMDKFRELMGQITNNIVNTAAKKKFK